MRFKATYLPRTIRVRNGDQLIDLVIVERFSNTTKYVSQIIDRYHSRTRIIKYFKSGYQVLEVGIRVRNSDKEI